MKQLILFLFIVGAIKLQAQTEKECRLIAKHWFWENGGDTLRCELIKAKYDTAYHFVFNFGNKEHGGYVIIRRAKTIFPILGYDLQNKIVLDGNKNNPIYDMVAIDVEKVQQARKLNIPNHSDWARLRQGKRRVKALVKTVPSLCPYIMNQDVNFWDSMAICPIHHLHAYTGCGPTVAATLCAYWKYPATGIGSHSYTDQIFGLQSADFTKSRYDWTGVPYVLNSPNPTVCKAMKDFGIGCEAELGDVYEGGTGIYVTGGAPSAIDAYVRYWGYKNTISAVYQTNANFESSIQAELNAGRLVQIFAYTPQGEGHTFICDGFDINKMYHIRWGWGSSGDGFFALTALNVNGFQFTQGVGVLIGIQPPAGVVPPTPCQLSTLTFTKPALTDTVTASTFTNDSIYSWTIQIGTAAPYTVIGSNKIFITAPYATTVTATLNKTCRGGTTSQTTGSYVTPSNCGVPTGLITTTSITPVPSATFNWQPVAGAASYLLWFGINASNGGYSTVTVNTNTWKLNFGITNGSSYWWKIKCNCTTTGASAWSDTMRYTIGTTPPLPPPSCPAPTFLKETPTVQATISWAGSATNYTLNYKIASATNYTPVTGILGNSYTMPVITDSLYNFNVVGVCNGVNSIVSTGSFIGGK